MEPRLVTLTRESPAMATVLDFKGFYADVPRHS